VRSVIVKRLGAGEREDGFTLVELMVVLVILAILVAAGIASYIGFRDRANDTSTAANLKGIVPAIEAYYAANSTYAGMTPDALRADYDQSIQTIHFTVVRADGTTYCVESNWGAETWRKNGPNASLEKLSC
jgi:prepilin-type N-terminal cleavage/methylation domain-containing protein